MHRLWLAWLVVGCVLLAVDAQAGDKPAPARIAVLSLDRVQAKSRRLEQNSQALLEEKKKVDRLEIQKLGLQNKFTELGNQIKARTVNLADQEVRKNIAKLQTDLIQSEVEIKEAQAAYTRMVRRMTIALMMDIKDAVDVVAAKHKVDLVINRRDAELTAKLVEDMEKDKAAGGLGAAGPDAPGKTTGDPEKKREQRLSALMQEATTNTFVVSNDTMDITDLVIDRLNGEFAAGRFKRYEHVTLDRSDPELKGKPEDDDGDMKLAE